MQTTAETVRPFFLPLGLDLDALPSQLTAALEEIVVPVYHRYVLGSVNLLERATGTSLAFLLAQEVVAQFELGQAMFGTAALSPGESAQRQLQIDGYFRVLRAKMSCANLLQRLTQLRMKKEFDHVLDV